MPTWARTPHPIADLHPTADLAAEFFTEDYGHGPTAAATAPGTFAVIGELSDYYGGHAIMGTSEACATVAIGPREDNEVRVTIHSGAEESFTDATTVEEIDRLASERTPRVDDKGLPIAPPDPTGGIAVRLAGLARTLTHRHILHRDTAGLNIAAVTSIPAGAGFGDLTALEAAFALAAATGELDDPPLRAKLVECCVSAAYAFSAEPTTGARYSASLRGDKGFLVAINYTDGSVSQIPRAEGTKSRAVAAIGLVAGAASPLAYDGAEHTAWLAERRRRHFLDAACHTFGTPHLRALPDAAPRVAGWLRAFQERYPDAGSPAVGEATEWIEFYDAETKRARDAAVAARSRMPGELRGLIAESVTAAAEHTGVQSGIVDAALSHGARCAFPANPLLAASAVAIVAEQSLAAFTAAMSAEGVAAFPLGLGSPAAGKRCEA